MDESQDYPWRESHAYFAGYDDGVAGTDALRSTWSDWPEEYERGHRAGDRVREADEALNGRILRGL